MDGSGFADCHFVGDFDDPWVSDLADRLPREVGRLHAAGALPRPWPESVARASAVILHRPWLTNSDAERVLALRARAPGPPRVLLCTGLLPRYQQMERWMPLVDRMVPETVPPDLLLSWLQPNAPAVGLDAPPRGVRPTLAVVSRVYELRQVLAEIVRRAGYSVQTGRDWCDVPHGLTALWDVPTLDPGWEQELTREAHTRRVVALAPFLDRALVTRLRDAGAQAWLDLPCDPDDLIWLVERMLGRATTARPHGPHEHPPDRHGSSLPKAASRDPAPMAADSLSTYNASS